MRKNIQKSSESSSFRSSSEVVVGGDGEGVGKEATGVDAGTGRNSSVIIGSFNRGIEEWKEGRTDVGPGPGLDERGTRPGAIGSETETEEDGSTTTKECKKYEQLEALTDVWKCSSYFFNILSFVISARLQFRITEIQKNNETKKTLQKYRKKSSVSL